MRQTKISFLLTRAELKLVKGILYLEPCLVNDIEKAKVEKGKYRVEFSVGDLAECLGALSYSTSYTQSCGKREELYSLYDKINSYLAVSQRLRWSRIRKHLNYE